MTPLFALKTVIPAKLRTPPATITLYKNVIW
jgi:hypothetical protein